MENLGINGPLLLAQLINFTIVVLLIRWLIYTPIKNIFEQRREKIAAGLAEAELAREEAAAQRAEFETQLAAEREASQARLREAVSRSEEAAERRLAEANAEAEEILARARAEAEQTRGQALAGLQGDIADLALMAAAKVVSEEIDEQKHRSLVDSFLKEQLGEVA